MSPAEQQQRRPSLRTRLFKHLMPGLLLSWVLGSSVALYTATYFTQLAYDRSMLDDAQLISSHVHLRRGKLTLEATEEDLQSILYDANETIYFAVLAQDGSLIAGTRDLVLPTNLDDSEAQFTDMRLRNTRLKGVVMPRSTPLPYRVIVAVTTGSRDTLLNRLIVASIVPQALLLLVLALWLRRVIRGELQPIRELQQSVELRDSADLSPLPPELTRTATSRDVYSLATAIDGLLKRIEQSLLAQREFAGNVAHELRTPLAGVRAAAEYGLAHQDPALWQEQLRAVLASEQRASHLVKQLLALALAQEASSTLKLVPLKLNECVRDLVLNWLPRADQLGIELVASGLDEDTIVRADRALVEGLLGNLLENAFRHGRGTAGSGDTITIVLSPVAGDVWLSVIDQGPGISPEQRTLLRNRWQQGAADNAPRPGSGLGLAICERFTQLMHAQLVLDSGFGGIGLRASVVFEGAASARREATAAPAAE